MSRARNALFFVLASVFFGGTFVAARAGQAYFPPLLFVAFRFDIAATLLFAYMFVSHSREQWIPRTRGDVAGILATGVLAIGLSNALLFVGQQYATSAVGSIIYSLNPIFTPVLASVLLSDEKLSVRGASGMLIGLVGVVLVVDPDPASLLGGGLVGKAILLAAATTAALGSVLIRRSDASITSTVRTAWGLPFSAVMLHGMSLGGGESLAAVHWTPMALATLGYVSVFAGAVAYIAFFGLLDEVGAIRANLIYYVSPVVATLGGWALLGEQISTLTVVGFAVIFAGFAVLGQETITAELSRLYTAIRDDSTPTSTVRTVTNSARQNAGGETQD